MARRWLSLAAALLVAALWGGTVLAGYLVGYQHGRLDEDGWQEAYDRGVVDGVVIERRSLVNAPRLGVRSGE